MPTGRPLHPTWYGDIILVADLGDPQGRNLKDRPCVVVTDPKLPSRGRTQLMVAISTAIPAPVPPDHVLLP